MHSITTNKLRAPGFPVGQMAAVLLCLVSGMLFTPQVRAQGLMQQYWVDIEVASATAARQDRPVDAPIDLTSFLASIPGTLDVQSLQVAEVDGTGAVIDAAVLFQFDQDPGFDPTTNAAGTLVFIMDGVTPAATTRYYQLAFDLDGACPGCPAPPLVTNPVSVDSLTYENQLTYEVTTPQATYRYHKQGAGLASMIDNDTQDWISFRDIPGSGSTGEWRGIPNLVFDAADPAKRFFHPGFTNGTSELVSAGPLKVVVRSQAGPPENFWDVLWEFYPDYARMTVLAAGPSDNGPYWFLYEGTIGGAMDAGDVVVRSGGTQTSAFDYGAVWEETLAPPEWVYFRDTASARALFIADDLGDSAPDSYRPLGPSPASDPQMTVFGFGRVLNTSPSSLVGRLAGADRSFTMGFVEDHTLADAEISGAVDPLTVVVGAVGMATDPVARDDAYTTPPNVVLTVAAVAGVLANDSGGGSLTAILQDDVASGLLALNADGSFDYTPNPGFTGTDSFTYRASDGVLDSLATVTIAVVLTSTAVTDFYQTDEDAPLVVPATSGLLANDQATNPADGLNAVLMAVPAHGSLVKFGADGGFTYVPDPDFHGKDSFTYLAVDGGDGLTPRDKPVLQSAVTGMLDGASDGTGTAPTLAAAGMVISAPAPGDRDAGGGTYGALATRTAGNLATVRLTVLPVNDEPVAVGDSYATDANTPLAVNAVTGVLQNDSDIDQDPLQAVLVDDVTDGVLVLNPDGSFTYTPDLDFDGTDGFTYRASDGVLDALASVTITVSTVSVNTPPRFVTGAGGFLPRQVIGSGVDETHAVVAADFDGDGDIDAAATDFFDDSVFWYEHDGNGGYLERTVDAALDGAYPLSVGDVDQDGDPDLLACGYEGDTVAWYENDGFANFTRHDVDTAADGAHSVVIGDLDQDGDIDLVTTNQDGNSIWWYENTGNENFLRIEIDTTATGAKRAEIADVDGDGDWDIVSAAYFTDLIAWHENDGNQNFTRRTIDNTVDGPYFVTPVDVDNDGDIDVLSASRLGSSINLHVNDGNGNFTNQAIDTNAQGARMVIAADIDGDGDPDAIASSVLDDTIALFENDGAGNFTEIDAIDLGADGAYGLFAVDADLDGDLDVMSANRDADNVALHRQVRFHTAQLANNTSTLIIDAAVIAAADNEQGPAQLIYTLTDPPQTGEVRLSGVAVSLNGTFTQDDINNALVTYVPDGVELYQDEFTFTVADGVVDGFTPTTGILTVQFADVPTAEVAHWPLDEIAGTTAADVVGGFNGTLAGDPVWLPGGGRVGGALELDGTGDQVDIGPIDIPAGNGMTAALWLRPAVTGVYERLISKATGAGEQDHYWMVSLAPSGGLRFRLKAGGVTSTLLTPTGQVTVGEWYHVACTYDKQFMRIYGNGVLIASLPKTGTLDVAPAVAATIGNQPPGAGDDPFVGALDEVRLYFKALTEAEITALADPGTGEPVLVAPTITSTAVTAAFVGQPYTYDVAASGNPVPTFSLTTNPAGMTIDAVTGLITWTPAAPGDQAVDVLATNSEGTDNQLFTVSVLPAPNMAPTVAVTAPTPGAVFLLGDPVPLTATADDTDGTVTQVEFLVDGAVLTTLFSPPWTTVWNGAAVGTHVIVARATDDESAVTASQAVPININDPSVPSRVDAGLVALYKFATGSGSVVQDVSGAGTPLDLTINDPGAVTWLPGGGLSLDTPTIVRTAGPATKMIDAVTTSDAITVEAWLTPAQLAQTGPARIVTCSSTLTTRNFTLGHEGSGSDDRYVMRLRTSTTTTNGTPETATDNGTLTTDLTHVVYTRDAAGLVTIYLDGGLSRTGFTYGSTTNWDAGYAFALGNELTEDRPWLGTYYLVALYDRALTQAEIVQNNTAGPYGQPVPAAPVITSAPVAGATLGQLYQYDVDASGYPLPGYSLVTSPAGMTIDAASGVISWTPGSTGIQTVEVAASSPEGTDTQVFDVTVYPSNPVQIAFWHGNSQRVGHLGPAQADFNVLGKVSPVADVATLEYKLNSGQYQPLTIGPDFLRLAADGDFNADIPLVLLDVGPNIVTVRATGTTGQITTATMTVTVETGGDYTLPATIAWSGVSDPQDVGQYVDGLWQLDNGALDVVEPGYDRIFLVGNENWQDYETLVPITINDVTRTGAGLGILMRFTGHIVGGHRNWPVTQPKMGYQPFGAIGWLRWVNGATVDPRIQFYPGDSDFAKTEWDISAAIGPADGAGDDAEPLPFGDPSQVIDFGSLAMVTGETFWMKMRCETLPDSTNGWGKTRYSYKVWRSTVSEPASWDFSETQVSEHALRLGGVALLAHHVDATFGDVQVTAIPPSTAVTSLAFNKAGDEGSVGPKRFALHQNHPNPFNPQTNIALDVPRESRVGVRIYDIRGRAVRNLFTGNLPPGTHTFKWDGRDDSGRGAAGGIYFLRMVAGEYTATRKMTLVR